MTSIPAPTDIPPAGRSGNGFAPDKLPRLLSPHGALSRWQFFTDSLKLGLIALLFALLLVLLPQYLHTRGYFDDLPGGPWLALQVVWLIAILFCAALALWADLCLHVKRLRDAGGHWSIALAVCAGVYILSFAGLKTDDLAFVKTFVFVLFLLLRPRRRPAGVLCRTGSVCAGGRGWPKPPEEETPPSPSGG